MDSKEDLPAVPDNRRGDEKKGVWNSKLEEAAQSIGQAAQGYKHMHIWQAQEASRKHSCLMGSGIVVGPLASVLSSIGLALGIGAEPTISVFTIVLGFVSGILVATVKFGKYDEVSNANKSAAARYTSIESNVRRQLSLYRNDRIAAIPYMDWLETKYQELLLSAPLLPPDAYVKFSTYAQKNGLSVPKQYDNMISITAEEAHNVLDTQKIEVVVENEGDESASESSKNNKIKIRRKYKRSSSMAKIPQLNQCSDKMLEYEMRRMMGIH